MYTDTTAILMEHTRTSKVGGLQELLCLAIHEGDNAAMDELKRIMVNITPYGTLKAYLQDADGNETELKVQEPDPADGTFLAFAPEGTEVTIQDNDSWVRITGSEG